MPLTNTQCQNVKAREKIFKLADGGGMYLEVTPNGSKYWRLKYRFLGKEKRLAFGVYPETSLAEAREQRDAARKLLKTGLDPAMVKKQAKQQAILTAANTFEAVAREWHEIQRERWSERHAATVLHRMELNIFPYIGSRPVTQITPPELLDVLRRVEKRGALELVSSLKQNCGQVFRYSIQTGRGERDPAADLKGALKTNKTTHYPALEAKNIPDFIKALERNDARLFARTRRAIKFSMLTFCRPGEIRQAQWQEIDFDTATWIIPGHKMKMKRDHVVPLSRQVLEILKEQKEETAAYNADWVFPSQHKPRQCMSDGTVNRALQRLGFGKSTVAHGFRALARTCIREQLGYDSEIIERQLAHKTSNPLGEAYDRVQFLDKRREMMQAWADYLDKVTSKTL